MHHTASTTLSQKHTKESLFSLYISPANVGTLGIGHKKSSLQDLSVLKAKTSLVCTIKYPCCTSIQLTNHEYCDFKINM